MSDDRVAACELCGREVSRLTVHHLIPRTRHSNKTNKKLFSRDEVRERTAMLCRPCHANVHAVLGEKELEREWSTLEKLATHPEIVRFTTWIASKPDGTTVRVKRNRRSRSQGRAGR